MDEDRNVPNTIEQLCVNNMVNVEAILECLIEGGIIEESKFTETKSKIEQRIVQAQQAAASAESGDAPQGD